MAAAAILTILGLHATAASAAPSLGLSATDAVIGGTIQATAQLSEAPGATGTISFEVFGPEDPICNGPALTPAPADATVSGEGNYTSGTFTPSAPGTYRWSAHYSGDGENPAADANCAALSTVTKASPSLFGLAESGVVGGTIGDAVSISGGFSPSGEVTFTVYGPDDLGCTTPLDSDTVPLEGSTATAPDFSPQQAGQFRWIATYLGDANNEAASTLCGEANQTSVVGKASPGLSGVATSAKVGLTITDTATLAGGFQPTGQLTFLAYGPDNPTCSGAPAYGAELTVAGNGPYTPGGFAPPPGLYLWTVSYSGDSNNAAASTACGAANQASAVGTVDVGLTASASADTIGGALSATATLTDGANPTGQLTFKAFLPGDTSCSGAAAFTSTVPVSGDGSYRSASFTPNRVGSYRWTVVYSGDANHNPASVGCGTATSAVAKASPAIAGQVGKRLLVGKRFRDAVTLAGGFSPTGSITFAIYAPGTSGCAKPSFVNTVAVNGNGTYRSDPFVAKRAGNYRFLATYSGDASNRTATEPCDGTNQLARVQKRKPKLRPLARLLDGQQISIRARLSAASSPTGVIAFRLYGPDDNRCTGRPAFAGSLRVKANGTFPLAEYIATKPGTYRLALSYSGDPRNRSSKVTCAASQAIVVSRAG